MRLRRPSVRWAVFLLVLVPLLAAVAIYAFAVSAQFGNALGLANAGKVSGATIRPVSAMVAALSAERDAAVRVILFPSVEAYSTRLRQQEAVTDRAIAVVRGISQSGPVTANASALEKKAAAKFIGDLVALNVTRDQLAVGSGEAIAVIKQYAVIINDGLTVSGQAIEDNYTNPSLAPTARAEVELYQAAALASEEEEFYVADVEYGNMTPGDQIAFAQLADLRQYLVQQATPRLNAEATALLKTYVPYHLAAALVSQENAITGVPAASAAAAVSPTRWRETAGGYADNLVVALTTTEDRIQSQLASSARRALTILIARGVLGLLAVIVSIAFSLLIARYLVRRLADMREAALDLAHHRLPNAMARLRNGETVDVEAETPTLVVGSDEIGQVQQAISVVLRAAVQAGADEADLRRGINHVFRNLARRNQALLHRQLDLLDGMERRADEPEQLEDLFRIDHLTTRMRRHAEGLIILSGESPGRTWSQPVPFIDVLRAAVAEVEDYARVDVDVRNDSTLAGYAVADVVHMLAELIENATVFSPPTTQVYVRGDAVGSGFAVEIEDRGLGISAERLEQINRDLAEVPAFDLAESDRLGLFITGRLAHRHHISVRLQSAPHGGTTAVVVIPMKLVVPDDDVAEPPIAGRLAPSRPAALANGRQLSAPVHEPRLADRTSELDAWTGSHWWTKPGAGPRDAPASAQHTYADHLPGASLPVRIPQANLAPQLREANRTRSGAQGADTTMESAEAARTSMSALQQGWERGRNAAGAPTAESDTGKK